MPGLLMIPPMTYSLHVGAGTSAENVRTPSPREVWAITGASIRIVIDLGVSQRVDTIVMTGITAAADSTFNVQLVDSAETVASTPVTTRPLLLPGSLAGRGVALVRVPSFVARFLRIAVQTASASVVTIGTLTVGLARELPYMPGTGRVALDMGRAQAFEDGGFGMEAGTVKSAFRWTLVDLDDATRDDLWGIAVDRGTTRPLVVVEGGTAPTPTAPEVHYGRFERFEPWDRQDPAGTRWSMGVEDWV